MIGQIIVKKLTKLKRLEDEQMPLAYHHHMGTVIQSHEDTERLLQETNDSVKLTIDTGHMLFAGNSLKIIKDFKGKDHTCSLKI